MQPDDPRLKLGADDPDPVYDRLQELFDRALEIPATTLAGAIAKARMLRHEMWLMNCIEGEFCPADTSVEFAWALVNELIGMERRG